MKLISIEEYNSLTKRQQQKYISCDQWSNGNKWMPIGKMGIHAFKNQYQSLPTRYGYVLNIYHKSTNKINGLIEIYKADKLIITAHPSISDFIYSLLLSHQ